MINRRRFIQASALLIAGTSTPHGLRKPQNA